MESPSAESFTWGAYFSVASLYALGHTVSVGATTLSGIPNRTAHSSPGEMRSFALSTLASVITSPGTTSACVTVAKLARPKNASDRRANDLNIGGLLEG